MFQGSGRCFLSERSHPPCSRSATGRQPHGSVTSLLPRGHLQKRQVRAAPECLAEDSSGGYLLVGKSGL